MCHPAALAIGGTAMQAWGQYQSAMAQRRAAEMQQRIGRGLAADAETRGAFDVAQHYQQVARAQGTQRAMLAASGVDVGSGSALDILTDTGAFGDLDARIIRSNAERAAYGHRAQAATGTPPASPWMGAGATLLTGAAQAGDYWVKSRQGGGVGSYGGPQGKR